MRSLLSLAASALAGVAAVVASLDGDADIVPFFVGLTFLGGAQAWATHPPFAGRRLWIGRAIAWVWALAAVWVAVLLLWYVSGVAAASGPPRGPEATYVGLTATVYHLVGLYGGVLLALIAAHAPDGWLRTRAVDLSAA